MRARFLAAVVALIGLVVFDGAVAAPPEAPSPLAARVADALDNVTTLKRPGLVGHATIWDANKWVQCRRAGTGLEMRCEAAGSVMQPTLARVLTPDRVGRIATLGWRLDPAFGNHVRVFAGDVGTDRIAEAVVEVLREGYDADPAEVEIATAWIAEAPCPPRAGPSQNLAGSVNGAAEMKAVVITACSYAAKPAAPTPVASADEVVARYGGRVTAEIQRLRINAGNRVFAVFDPGLGYIQCMPDKATRTLYCEAQSVEMFPPLAAVLTPERTARLKAAGYREPGRAPNHSKTYAFDTESDRAIATEILTLLHEVYGYSGTPALAVDGR